VGFLSLRRWRETTRRFRLHKGNKIYILTREFRLRSLYEEGAQISVISERVGIDSVDEVEAEASMKSIASVDNKEYMSRQGTQRT
jgi:hypothetical protein